MSRRILPLAGLCAGALAAASLAMPAQAVGLCAAPPGPESRSAAFDERVFQRDAATLSASGRAQFSALAQALEPASLELVVVSVPADAPAGRAQALQRAEAVRHQLARSGVPRDRIYVEQRRASTWTPAPPQAPVVVEAIAAWPRQLATSQGWRCVAQAPAGRGL
jgi:type IV pilus biogenesis protein CpaD/CtpE